VERILRLEETSTAGQCASCGAPHSAGAAYCWQCGQPLLQEVHTDQIAGPPAAETAGAPVADAPQQSAPTGDQNVTQRLPAL
jgi:predicted amidophosphoribosyltransferase